MTEFNPREYTTAAEKYAAIAQLAGFGGGNVRAGVKNLIREIRKMQEQLKMPAGLKDCGVLPEEYQKQKDAVAQGLCQMPVSGQIPERFPGKIS